MKVYQHITDLIGGTPLLRLTNYLDNNGIGAEIYARARDDRRGRGDRRAQEGRCNH